MARSADELRQKRVEKIRAGQQSGEPVALLSDPEQRMMLVPLTQNELMNTLSMAAMLTFDDNMAGQAARDELQRTEILAVSAREVSDLEKRYYQDGQAVGELEAHDINHLFDVYLEMVAEQNPSIMGLSEKDFDDLKKALQTMRWAELSGPQWYAAQRFLNSIRSVLLTVKLPGSSSTKPSTESKS